MNLVVWLCLACGHIHRREPRYCDECYGKGGADEIKPAALIVLDEVPDALMYPGRR